ncbi:glycoside hydrolase family 97 catalytic domain-containing protein [Viscerimonas tarda]
MDSAYYDGASLMIAKDNRIIYSALLGNHTPETVLHIASAGKWLAAATIAAVVDDRKLSWDDKVKKYLPEFKDIKGEASLRQLLSHTSGYPDYQPENRHRDDYQTLEESVKHIVNLPADTLPGTKFRYGGLAMQVAGRMAEIATGKDWETLFQEKIAQPLQMRYTHFTPVSQESGFSPMLGGSAYTSAPDYMNFLNMIFNRGVFQEQRILSEESIREMQADQVKQALVHQPEYVMNARQNIHKGIYGLGEWREEIDENGEAVLISSPGWAGAYSWIDKKNNIYGFFLAKVNVHKANADGFSSFYSSPELVKMVRNALAPTVLKETETTVSSPDGKQVFTFYQKKNANGTLEQFYKIDFDSQPLVLESKLDIQLDNHIWERALAKFWKQPKNWNDLMVFDKVETASHNETWKPLYGERSEIKDNYNAATIHFSRRDNSGYKMNIEVRAYNEGIAFRYSFPMHPEAIYHKVISENTEFTMPEGTTAWWTQWAQAPYYEQPLKDWEDESERPLTLKLSDNLYACITEAKQTDFPKTAFKLSNDKKNTIQTSLYGSSDMVTPFGTPWRVVMASNRLGQLLENNDILLNLNDVNKIVDADWIKPGKIMRETTLTTLNAKDCIDFCANHHMQYILFDWKWYGPSFDFNSDASRVVIPGLDMKEVVAYGKSKGIGVWLYVNQHALQYQADRIFPIYKEWGIAGVKFGFVQFKTQGWATWVHDLVKKAADNHLMVNIHDEYRPTGFSRTYPNLLTQEGIRGNEEFPDATHNTTLPFTRMIAGAADYTVCYFDPRIKNTHAHQLALPVVFYSPLQTLYWYDTPARIEDVPELDFFDKAPVTWDETQVIHDKIGEYVTIARRNNEDWFVGTIGNNDARKITTSLNFLKNGQKYVAHIYNTDERLQTSTKVKITTVIVDNTTLLPFLLKERDGCAIRLSPATKEDLKQYKAYKKNTIL